MGASKNYFNISQFRSETWYGLKNAAADLRRAPKSKELHATVNERFEVLELIEQYWAYPGMKRVKELQGMFTRHEYAAFANALMDEVRALVNETYNSDPEIQPSQNGGN